jgi:hypothetical protein
MEMRMKAILAAALVVVALPTMAAFGQEGVVVRAPRQMCRWVATSSQSRIARRKVCTTAAQRRAPQESSAEDVEDELDVISRQDPTRKGLLGFNPR